MKKIVLCFLATVTLLFTAGAQNLVCGYDLAVYQLDQLYPGYKAAVDATFEAAKKLAAELPNMAARQEVYTIPVVVHVVWKDSVENIPLSQIEDQMDVLNEAYRRLNADTVNTRDIFKPFAGDAKIEFVLTEVIRVKTDASFSPTLTSVVIDQVKQTANGGSDAADPVHFLNIWVCRINPISIGGINLGQILGYAYPPADLANWPAGAAAPSLELEGVVVDFRAFGRGLTYDMQGMLLPIEGRTTVHEVGHYLGLRHIWGDGLSALLGIPDCNASDGIDDTPTQGLGSQFACNHNQNTCTDPGDDLPDMIENYMDYSREDCQNMLTHGQIAHIHAVLEGPRRPLWEQFTSSKSVATSTPVTMWPNPVTASLRIETAGNAAYTARVLNALGQPVQLVYFNGNGQIEMGRMQAGIYYVQLLETNTGKQVAIEKIAKW